MIEESNSVIPYRHWASAIRSVLHMQLPPDADEGTTADLQLQALDRIERSIAAGLVRSGMGSDAAASSALEFVRQCAERFLAERTV